MTFEPDPQNQSTSRMPAVDPVGKHARPDQPDPAAPPERALGADQPARPDRADRSTRSDGANQPTRAGRSARGDQPTRAARSSRGERPARVDRTAQTQPGQTQSLPVAGVRPVATDYRSDRRMNFGPEKQSIGKIVGIVIAVILVLLVALVAAEVGLNAGKVHHGVKVGGVDIGGLEQVQAVETLQTALDARLASTSVRATPSPAVLQRLEENTVDDSGAGSVDETSGEGVASPDGTDQGTDQGSDQGADDGTAQGSDGTAQQSSLAWSFSAADLGATVDAKSLVDEAMGVGAVTGVGDFFKGVGERFTSWLGQVDLAVAVAFNDEAVATSLTTVDDAIGVAMMNANIALDVDGHAAVTSGRTGEKADQKAFAAKASDVLAGTSGASFDVPMVDVAPDVDDAAAQVVADEVNATLSDPVTFVYGEDSWSVWAPMLGSWTKTEVQGEGASAKLIAQIDSSTAYDGLQQLMGEAGYGSAKNATFDVSSGTPEIVGGTAGTGPDIKTGIGDLGNVLYGSDSKSRTITLIEAEVDPETSAEAAKAMGITELVAEFKLGYGSGGGSNREYNIEQCLDKLSGSLIAPGSNWHWNEVVGLCDESTGYKEASVIVNNEIVQSAGGGICNVATGVYNAAYDAGLPIIERTNHSIFQPNYPLGRDAAVSWEYPTLVFANDMANYILVTATYDGKDMTISVWGTSEHRSVESSNSDWVTTDTGGKSITNYRTVKAADGAVLSNDSFSSYFPPEKKKEE